MASALPLVGGRRASSTPLRWDKLNAETIFYDRFQIPKTMGDVQFEAESNDRLIAKKNEAEISRSNGIVRRGNPAGLTILDRLDQLEESVRQQKDTIKEQNHTIKEQNARIERQDLRIDDLEFDLSAAQTDLRAFKAISKSFIALRNRFISKYIQDTNADNMSPEDEQLIKNGNYEAHHGDALTDAYIYKRKIRTDVNTYKELYGISPQLVLDYLSSNEGCMHKTLSVLSTHGSTMADLQFWDPAPSFFDSFTNFLNAWESGGYRSDYVHDPLAPETKAYRIFWTEWNKIPKKQQVPRAGNSM